ncbi:heavy-metal-associated domain-containing protein [Adhaeretor mobilis]|uniref:Zinc/cadmium/mercury/lead-transporting ATPase n=1 Tax=Adhaeretor mobilis TaxID=1930276 RepID=A0A517N3A9_9BACT|nr:MauE/DoxX family redox-associated membrane protein [Adhaeretor mobilis]QDT01614.1 zinc/cadmium/mercury/lead-transporting ATPase [Adhaeretor mobilis]
MRTTYTIRGMHCGACEQKIKNALEHLDAVQRASVSQPEESATIESSGEIDLESLRQAVSSAGDYTLTEKIAAGGDSDVGAAKPQAAKKSWLATYKPLLLIVGYCLGGTLLTGFSADDWTTSYLMSRFMGLFFVAFSFFKLLDLTGFAEAYSTYDVLAKRVYNYGFLYPFIELGLGIAYLLQWNPLATNIATLVVMALSTIGVVQAVMKNQQIQCACLGTVFDLPMTTVTIVEDVSMALMAALMLWQLVM